MYEGLNCPKCGKKTFVEATRRKPYGRAINRRRECRTPGCLFVGFTKEVWNMEYHSNMEENVKKMTT